jgi:hypothetical protein
MGTGAASGGGSNGERDAEGGRVIALRTLFGATTAVCRGEMDAATWLVDDAAICGLADLIVSISPVATRTLLRLADRNVSSDDPTLLTDELGLACRDRFPAGAGSIGALCLLAATGRIDPWEPRLVFDLGFADDVPVWGAVASTWFATERAAHEHRRDPVVIAERICLQLASRPLAA